MRDDYAEYMKRVKFASRPSEAKYQMNLLTENNPHIAVGRRFGKSIPTELYMRLLVTEYFRYLHPTDWRRYILEYPEWRIA